MRQNLSKICVSPEDSIRGALNKVSLNKPGETGIPAGIILVVDGKRKLLGIATDGDVRRALAKGASLDTPIFKIMNPKPFVIEGPKTNAEILSLVAEKIKKENLHKDRLNKIIVVNKNRQVENLIAFYDVWQRSDVRFKTIGIVGLGYVGLTLGLTLADLGFKVRGLDKDSAVKKTLKAGKAHFTEDGLNTLLKDHLGENFKVVDNFSGASNCDVYFVAVGTPLGKGNKPDLRYLRDAVTMLGRVLKPGDAVILRSTVPLGTTRNTVVPILEKNSRLKAGDDFLVAFAPERTVEGVALQELRKLPQVIGGLNRPSSDLAASIFSFMTHSVHILDTLEEAEIVKLINNTYRDLTFAYANEISLVCKDWGIDSHRVIDAANRGYERSSVPKPSPGVGGYCLEKDPFIFIDSAKKKNYELLLPRHARAVSNLMIESVANEVLEFLKNKKPEIKNPKVFIMGFAFKGRPVTSDTRGSTTIHLVKKLQNKIKTIYGHDPAVKKEDITKHGVRHVAKPEFGFAKADVILTMNNNPSFEQLDIRNLLKLSNKPAFLFDTWGLYKKEEVEKVKGITYKKL